MAKDVFIWTKFGDDAGEVTAGILQRKEAERLAGSFWWGVGSSLNRDKRRQALSDSAGRLQVVFSKQLSRPKPCESGQMAAMALWTRWLDDSGKSHEIPSHAMVISKAGARCYYALVCGSGKPLYRRDSYGRLCLRELLFDDHIFYNYRSDKKPCASQNTALLTGNLQADQGSGRYREGFRATLVYPWFVRLDRHRHRLLTPDEQDLIADWDGKHYAALVRRIRG
jgi:hypothetical protein